MPMASDRSTHTHTHTMHTPTPKRMHKHTSTTPTPAPTSAPNPHPAATALAAEFKSQIVELLTAEQITKIHQAKMRVTDAQYELNNLIRETLNEVVNNIYCSSPAMPVHNHPAPLTLDEALDEGI